jgi:hypothetical protein
VAKGEKTQQSNENDGGGRLSKVQNKGPSMNLCKEECERKRVE